MLGKGVTISCAQCLDPNRLWGSACGFIYVGVGVSAGDILDRFQHIKQDEGNDA